jgi:hypothetical protein|tara:strand:+ start:9442 stop:9591 length:150 start_codon:yes stop_codon:yes gene_type:complete
MVNLYDLEYDLLKKSKITDRSPKSIVDQPSSDQFINEIYNKEDSSKTSE